jgi:hypothetical protein
MSFGCKEVCTRYKAKKPKEGCYASGQKRCNFCYVFLNWDSFWCPCCGSRLRLWPRNSIYKERLKEKLTIMARI